MANPKKKKSPGTKPAGKAKPGHRLAGGAKVAFGKKGASTGGALRTAVKTTVAALVLGGLLGGGFVGAAARRAAEERVAAKLEHPVWSLPGKITSGPVTVWSGLALAADELAVDLQAAGYARVDRADKPGDFSVTPEVVTVVRRPEEGAGEKGTGEKITVTFADGRVTSPTKSTAFLPAVFATVRGADNEDRSPVPLGNIPKELQQAVLAMEDARFYQHFGVDVAGLSRAMFQNARAKRWVQGGSTLTQQVAKNLFLSADRTAIRKFDELFLALALEERLTKDEILALYLNEIYLGQSSGSAVCGVDTAARVWFGKPVGRLDLAESATLAGVISAPNQYSPIRHPEAAVTRRNIALDRMVEVGFLDLATATHAKAEPLGIIPEKESRRAPWAMDTALELVEAEAGEGAVVGRSLRVQTTLSPALQRLAERAVAEGAAELIAAHPKLDGVQMALVSVRVKDGAVLAMVGGRDYGKSSYNRAILSSRLVGSTVKPLTMLAAFDADPTLDSATRLDDAPLSRVVDGRDWTPENYDHQFVGPISIQDAMAGSRNIPAVLLAEHVGLSNLKREWQQMGLSGATDWPSAALGGFGATPLQLAAAYALFPGGGRAYRPWLVDRAREGEAVVYEHPTEKLGSYDAAAAFLALDVLRGVMRSGTGKGAAKFGVGNGVGGKSGTTDNYTDAWFVGFSAEIATAVWVGFDRDGKVGLTGSQAALPTWARFMAWSGTTGRKLTVPVGVEAVEVCTATDLPVCGPCDATRTGYFRKGQVPSGCVAEEIVEPGEPLEDVRIVPIWKRLFGR